MTVLTAEPVLVDAKRYPALRWRLAIELHARAYHEIGVEVQPGPAGSELDRRFRVSTPHCRLGDRWLADLAWDLDAERMGDGRTYGDWSAFVAHAFDVLDVPQWRVRRHLGCFHRRGKARLDLTFEVLGTIMRRCDDRARVWSLGGPSPADPSAQDLLARHGVAVAEDKPARHLALGCCDRLLAVLRSDGRCFTGTATVDLDDLWWRGLGVAALADRVLAAAEHEH